MHWLDGHYMEYTCADALFANARALGVILSGIYSSQPWNTLIYHIREI